MTRSALKLLALLLLFPLAAQAFSQDWAKARLEQSPRHREWVTLKHDGRALQAYVVYPEVKRKATVVVLIHEIFGLQPYLGAGAGSTGFKPTRFGGEGAPEQARATYYYSLGVQKPLGEGHFGLRAGFRELFFLDPDFGQNYLTILKHANTYEPQAGFYLRY